MENEELKKYLEVVIPNIEKKLGSKTMTDEEMVELYKLYKMTLSIVAKDDFKSFNKYLELEEDHNNPSKAFYHQRKVVLDELFTALNDMEIYDKYDTLLISMPPRIGKSQPLDAGILTVDGWIKMGDVEIGTEVIGYNGHPTTVTGIFPQGELDVYEITFSDGTSTQASYDHLWSVQSLKDKQSGKHSVVTTGEMMNNLFVGRNPNYSIKYVKPVAFSDKVTASDVSPFLVGRVISKGDFENSKLFAKNDLTPYGLGDCLDNELFIPKKYLYSNVVDRVNLLEGLMSEEEDKREYTTTSKQLADDFVELIRSLGNHAELQALSDDFYGDEKIYTVKITDSAVFRNEKRIVGIKKVGKKECQCIMVDSYKHLYVTDGYNLTHNTTTGIRFLAWIIGRHPESTQLATSYSDNITTSFYIGVMEIATNPRYKEVFLDGDVVNQNAKREEIWIKTFKRYPSISFVPINGSMTGRSEASEYLYCDDLVSGIEEALSVTRLNNLWQKYTVNAKQRKKDGCKEIHIATNWSVHDPMYRLKVLNRDNDRCKILDMSCYDENGESNFNFNGGFSTEYYHDMEESMDSASFSALYKQEPIEREGLLYNKDELMYFFDEPKERPETIVAVCDSKNLGKDFVALPIVKVYGEFAYVVDVVYNNGLPDITKELVSNALVRNKVVRADIEMNNGGNYYAEGVNELVKQKGGDTTFRLFFTGNNKVVKIISYSDYVKKHLLFKDPSTYSQNSEYAYFMKDLLSWTQTGNNPHDDAPDSVAMLSQLLQDLVSSSVIILDRKRLGL